MKIDVEAKLHPEFKEEFCMPDYDFVNLKGLICHLAPEKSNEECSGTKIHTFNEGQSPGIFKSIGYIRL